MPRGRSKSTGHDPEKSAAAKDDPWAPKDPPTLRQVPVGYSRLATFINVSEDFAIFRRYGALRARSILYHQAELNEKEFQLHQLDVDEAEQFEAQRGKFLSRSVSDRSSSGRDRSTSDSEEIPFSDIVQNREWLSDNTERRRLMLEIRKQLKDYDEEIFRYKEMLALPKAKTWQIKYVRRWMESRPLVLLESHFLDDVDDVVALRKDPEDVVELADWLTKFLHRSGKIFRPFLKGHAPAVLRDEPNIVIYSKDKKHYVWRLLFAIVAAAVLLAGVIALYFVESPGGRLAVLSAATAACSIIIATMTGAKKSEVFGASAAYCAVLVVFVGTTSNNQGSKS